MEKISTFASRIIRISYILLFILVPIILTPWNYELFEYNKMMVTYGFAVIIGTSWIIKMIADREIRISRTPLDIPIILFVSSQLVSTLFSIDPHISWFGYYSRFNGGMMSVFTYVLLYYGLVTNFITPWNAKRETHNMQKNKNDMSPLLIRLLMIMVVTGFVVAIYGVAEHFGIDKHLWIQDVQNRVFSTLGQPNWLAAYLVAIIPISMGLGIKSQITRTKSQTNSNIQVSNKRQSFSILNFDIVCPPAGGLQFVIWNFVSIIFFTTLLWTRSRSGLLAFSVVDILFWLTIFADKKLALPWRGWNFDSLTNRWKNWPLKVPFLLVHGAFILIIFINGTYIENIDRFITLRGWQDRFTQIQSKTVSNTATSAIELKTEQSQPVAGPLLETGGTESGTIRKYVWQGALNAWKSSRKALLIGTGTETYAFAFYRYKPIGHNLTSEWDFLYNKAHNEYLNYLATTGIFGLGTYLFLIGNFIYWFIKSQIASTKNQTNHKSQYQINKIFDHLNLNIVCDLDFGIWILRIALFCGWLSILITNFFGFSVVVIQLLFFLIPAIIFSLNPETLRKPRTFPLTWNKHAQKGVISGISSVGILVLCLLSVTWYADKLYATGYHLSKAGYMTQAYQNLTSAITYNPTEPLYRDELSSVLSSLALASSSENEATLSSELIRLAVKESDKAITTSPNNVNFWKTRTKVLYALSSFDPEFLPQAIQALEKARELSPYDPKIYYNLAILFGREGNLEKAVTALQTAIDFKPNYRDAHLGLVLFYQEAGQGELAKQAALMYITNVDPNDEEMKGYTE